MNIRKKNLVLKKIILLNGFQREFSLKFIIDSNFNLNNFQISLSAGNMYIFGKNITKQKKIKINAP